MTTSTDGYVSVDFYNERQYPYGCSGATTATLTLLKDGRKVKSTNVQSMNGYGYMYISQLDKGASYCIQVSNLNWGRDSVRDYTVSLYS